MSDPEDVCFWYPNTPECEASKVAQEVPEYEYSHTDSEMMMSQVSYLSIALAQLLSAGLTSNFYFRAQDYVAADSTKSYYN